MQTPKSEEKNIRYELKRKTSLLKLESYDFWLDIRNVIVGPEIGSGNFSSVFVAKYFGDLVAVKKQVLLL